MCYVKMEHHERFVFPLVAVVIMIYYFVAALRGWDSHVLSAGQAEEEAGSFRNLIFLLQPSLERRWPCCWSPL